MLYDKCIYDECIYDECIYMILYMNMFPPSGRKNIMQPSYFAEFPEPAGGGVFFPSGPKNVSHI